MESKQPQDTESRHADKYIVRFPDGMRDRLKAEAKANNRTLNAEIVARLQESFNPSPNIFINDIGGVTALVSPRTKLTQLAGDLNSLQDQRNTLAVLLHAVKTSGRSADEVSKITQEISAIDADITSILSAMHNYTSRHPSDH